MIKGLSDEVEFPRLGKIHLGVRISNKDGTIYPKATDYFVCPEEVRRVYGNTPRELDILFPTNDEEQIFPQWYKRYGSNRGLLCRGDGETAVQFNPKTKEKTTTPCNPDTCTWFAKKHCRRIANLKFMLPKVKGVGLYQIDTASYFSIKRINSALKLLKSVNNNQIAMIPLKLVLKPLEIVPDGKDFKKTVYVMDIIAEASLEDFLAIQNRQLLLPAGNTTGMTPATLNIPSNTQPEQSVQQPGRYHISVRLTAKPIRPVNLQGTSTWSLEVERNTKSNGIVAGRLLVPTGAVSSEFIYSLEPGSIITAMLSTPPEIGEKGFLIKADTIEGKVTAVS